MQISIFTAKTGHILPENIVNLDQQASKEATRPRGYKTFFMLNSTEHEISTAHKN